MSSSRKRAHGEKRDLLVEKIDNPPFSRVFIKCSTTCTENDIRDKFGEYGTIEDIWLVKDKETRQNRGIAYVKYQKMSEATLAVEGMDGKYLSAEDEDRVKVSVAQPKSSKRTDGVDFEKTLSRVYISIPNGASKDELVTYFSQFGHVEYVDVIKDRHTGNCKGFGFVKYKQPYHAAIAIETAEKHYCAAIAEPKKEKINREGPGPLGAPGREFPLPNRRTPDREFPLLNRRTPDREFPLPIRRGFESPERLPESRAFAAAAELGFPSDISNKLVVQAHISIGSYELKRLFDIIPGMEYFNLEKDPFTGESLGVACVEYGTVGSAVYAKEKLQGFPYPLGYKLVIAFHNTVEVDRLPVRPREVDIMPVRPHDGDRMPVRTHEVDRMPIRAQEVDRMSVRHHEVDRMPVRHQVSSIENMRETSFFDDDISLECSVRLPSKKPLADKNASLAMRIFMACDFRLPFTDGQLADLFSKFGNLIEAYFSKMNVAYAKYASSDSAREAIRFLHDSKIGGIKMRVQEASLERQPPKRQREEE